jgi:hypothetical protein
VKARLMIFLVLFEFTALAGADVPKAGVQVYKPAGMTDTDAYEMDLDTPNLATGYTSENLYGQYVAGPRSNDHFLHVVKGGPAGGGFPGINSGIDARYETSRGGAR